MIRASWSWLGRHRMVRMLAIALVGAGAAAALVLVGINAYVLVSARSRTFRTAGSVPRSQAAIVFGAAVYSDGRLSAVTEDRVLTAVDLYRSGRVGKLLLSGDHGQPDYDEVNPMRRYALEAGVPAEDVFMDHAGFSTYDTVARAMRVFELESAVLVTQRFHLPRALFIARRLGLEAVGIQCDRRPYREKHQQALREWAARVKDFLKTLIRPAPKLLGPAMPITGDGRATVDAGPASPRAEG